MEKTEPALLWAAVLFWGAEARLRPAGRSRGRTGGARRREAALPRPEQGGRCAGIGFSGLQQADTKKPRQVPYIRKKGDFP